MAKDVYQFNSNLIARSYEINTVVTGFQTLYDNAVPPAMIGTRVFVANSTGITVNMGLKFGPFGLEVAVSGVGGGSFTCSPIIFPAPGTPVISPWYDELGNVLYTRENNSLTLNYHATGPELHDIYVAFGRDADSGSALVYVDGVLEQTITLYTATPIPGPVDYLIKADVPAGDHTVVITASIGAPRVWIYFYNVGILRHTPMTGGEYLAVPSPLPDFQSPPLNSAINWIGPWSTIGSFGGGSNLWIHGDGFSLFFYPQIEVDSYAKLRYFAGPSQGIAKVYINGVFAFDLDMYDALPQMKNATILENIAGVGTAPGDYAIEIRSTNTNNPLSSNYFMYVFSVLTFRPLTNMLAVQKLTEYLIQLANHDDGGFSDAIANPLSNDWRERVWHRYNFDALGAYACMGLLAAYQLLGDARCLDTVKKYLLWLKDRQAVAPGNPAAAFVDGAVEIGEDGCFRIGYERDVNTEAYAHTPSYYTNWGLDEFRWQDSTHGLPPLLLYWYWKVSGDDATRDLLVPYFKKAMDGYIKTCLDGKTGLFFSGPQHRFAITKWIYHDGVRVRSAADALLQEWDDLHTDFFTYELPASWSSNVFDQALNGGEQETVAPDSFVKWELDLTAGQKVYWLTHKGPNVCIAEAFISNDGLAWTSLGTFDNYNTEFLYQQEVLIYTAAGTVHKHFKVVHTGTGNPAQNITPGWYQLEARYGAGQFEIGIGLTALWIMTRDARYGRLAGHLINQCSKLYWNDEEGPGFERWYKGILNRDPLFYEPTWYPHIISIWPWAFDFTRMFSNKEHLATALRTMTQFQQPDGSFIMPTQIIFEYVISAQYVLGNNFVDGGHVDEAAYLAAVEHVKSGIFLFTVKDRYNQPSGTVLAGGLRFSQRYPYMYSGLNGHALLAMVSTIDPEKARIPFDKDFPAEVFGTSRVLVPRRGSDD